MNKEYKERIKRADDAAHQFFEQAEKSNIPEMLKNDGEIKELYLKAFDVTDNASEEEKDFYFSFTDYFLYKGLLLIWSGEFAKQVGNKKCLTSKELKPVYNELTGVLNEAISQNDRYKPLYIERKADTIFRFNEELLKQGIRVKESGCYIATAVYGSYDCPEVQTLRRYRDSVLANNLLGRTFIHIYYAISPALVKLVGNKKWFCRLMNKLLDKLIWQLQDKGYGDTPHPNPAPQVRHHNKNSAT